jgi:glutamine amidotransferase
MSDEVIDIVDYGLGNLGSIVSMLRRLGIKGRLISTPSEIKKSSRIILPGVGAFDAGMQYLKERNLFDVLNDKALVEKVPIMGICLGMQLLTEGSEEGESKEKGFGWIKGRTIEMRQKADQQLNLKFPHIGWNYIDEVNPHPITNNLPEDPRFYFVHGFMVECDSKNNVVATTDYGNITFTSICQNDNIFGAQFHPEKSHKFGMQLFRNFSKWRAA